PVVHACSWFWNSVEALLEVTHLFLGTITLPTVLLLQLPGQILSVALGHVENVVGELAPLGLRLTLQLGPLAGNDVLVHVSTSFNDGGAISTVRRIEVHRAGVGMSMRSRFRCAGLHAGMACPQRGSVAPVLSAASSTFSPTFCTSLPAPATVLHALSMPAENIEIRIRIAMRFMVSLHRVVDAGGGSRPRAGTCNAAAGEIRVEPALQATPEGRIHSASRGSVPHQGRLAEQALHQVHRQPRGAVALVQRGIHLDHVERI